MCITYGEDNSCSSGVSDKTDDDDNDCREPDATCLATVSYKSPETPIGNIGTLVADGTNFDITLTGETWYEILGLGKEATVRQYIRMLFTGSGDAGDKYYIYFVYASSDGTLDGYLLTSETGASVASTLERYTKTGTTLPNFNVASAVPDFASAGFSLVHTDTLTLSF